MTLNWSRIFRRSCGFVYAQARTASPPVEMALWRATLPEFYRTTLELSAPLKILFLRDILG
jgi:hypothetical protein